MAQIMTTEHLQWDEFYERLSGPEGCNFHEEVEGDGKWKWSCKAGRDKTFATAILKAMSNGGDTTDFDVPASLAYFDEHGGHCDCEILFNVAD